MARHLNNKSGKPLIFLVFICIFALLGASLWVTLKHGIVLDRIKLSFIKAERISVRVNHGIIISIDQLDVLDRQTTGSLVHPELFITRFNNWAHLFREIRINRIHYKEHAYYLLFKDNQFTVSGVDFQLAGSLAYENGAVQLDISKLEIKPFSVTLVGKATYIRKTEKLNFSGRFSSPEISGQLTFSQLKHQVNAEINTDQFTDLPNLIARFPLDEELTTWISENISARYYQVEQLKLSLTLQKGKPDILPSSISGKGIATDAAIRFHPALLPVQSKQIPISFENDQLSFDLDEPRYKNKSLAGSSVSIDHLLAGDSKMNINLRTKTQLDSEALKLLETYDIRLPLSQQTGSTQANLHLIFDLPGFTLHTKGVFATGKGNWTWDNASFQTSGAAVRLKDNLMIIDNAGIVFQDIIQADLAGTIDTTAQKAALTTNIKHLNLRDGEKDIVKAQNLTIPINIQFSREDVNIHMLTLQANIALNPSRRRITLDSLKKVSPFIPSLRDFPFQDGRLNIDFTNLANLTFAGFINTNVLPLSLNNQPVTQFTFQGSKTAEKLTAMINEGKISLTVADKLHIDLRDYLFTIDTDTFGRKAGPSSPIPISISGLSSMIKLKNISIPTKTFQADLKDQDVSLSAALNQGKILFESNGLDKTLAASGIDAQIAQDFFQFADLEGGRFNLSLKGKDDKNFEGFVEFSNVLIKDAALLNNVLSFINAIPALATLSSPGFDANGYHVSQGVAQFARSNNLLTIQKFRTDGTTINTEAEGWLDFENDLLKINLELISLKDYSKIISKIPWAGYAILGENNSLSTSLLVSGNRHNPEITTNLTGEIVMMPINIVKRTIQWPFRLLDKIMNPATETPNPVK